MPEYLFIYDHNILDGKEDTNYDPTEAILYFYPSSTSLDLQHSLCSHVMGFCQILSNLFKSSPKLFKLDSGAKVACIHMPNLGLVENFESSRVLTFALYSDENFTIHLHEKCTLLYESIIFYTKQSLPCLFSKGKSKSKYINTIITRLMNLINHRDKLSSIFDTSLYCQHNDKSCNIIDALVYQTMINIVDSICKESLDLNVLVLGGCLFYKKCLILNQFSVMVSNLFSLFIDCLNNDLNKNGKETFNSLKRIKIDTGNLQARDGVFVFQICITQERYSDIIEFCQGNNLHVQQNNCCESNEFHYLYLYLEHHSDMTILFLIDESDFNKINKDLLKVFSSLCFNLLGEIEANIATTTTMKEVKEDSKPSIGNCNVWNISYDETDRSVNSQHITNGTNVAANWEEKLMKRISTLHENLEKEPTINEIVVKVKKETISVVRKGGQQKYTMKSTN